jgi:SAM-dependent methyltransferase
MNPDLNRQSLYWSRESSAFENIYTGNKSPFLVFLDKVFRKDMFERFQFTIKNCEPCRGKTFYDIGCGNGIYSIELAKRGAEKVIGLEISNKMILLSRKNAKDTKCDNICSFVLSDPLSYKSEIVTDTAIGIGLFDYIKDPFPVLKKMNELVKDKVIISFPRLWTWRAPIRKIRLSLKGCDVHFYSKTKIKKLLIQAGFPIFEIHKIGKLFCVIARKGINPD